MPQSQTLSWSFIHFYFQSQPKGGSLEEKKSIQTKCNRAFVCLLKDFFGHQHEGYGWGKVLISPLLAPTPLIRTELFVGK